MAEDSSPKIVKRKKRKEVIQVAGNPLYAPKISPKSEIINPRTNTLDWGQFPEIITAQKTFPAGPLRLRYGEHVGPQKGYGLAHIWEARNFFHNKFNTPTLATDAIADFLFKILEPGAEIYYEGNLATSTDKATVFKSSAGTVVVEERKDGVGNTFYSIVTAIPNNNARGTKIGTLL
ncbi:hypothetical protein ACO0LD_14480 [Undibacterium sp. Ji83W]|uniref:hypothetical protein n=1 Tax=Undibacterium sp. Ji83W TaxID=3413043 RepID=UPI003BF3928F